MPHIATSLGIKKDAKFKKAYWNAFQRFFGEKNSAVIKAMILAKTPIGDTGEDEVDRVCYGLRTTMAWLAEAVEKSAIRELEAASHESSRENMISGGKSR